MGGFSECGHRYLQSKRSDPASQEWERRKNHLAVWKPGIYTVTLHANGGAIASGKDITSYTYGAGATLPTENDITREGYTFDGWYADSSFSGAPVTAISSTDTGDKTFYAKWEANTYTVTVQNDGDGTGAATPAFGTMGGEITLTAMPNSGYRFKEWQIVSAACDHRRYVYHASGQRDRKGNL